MRHHIKIVASNFRLNYEHLYEFCLTLKHTYNYSHIGINITETICNDGKKFIDVPTSGTEKLLKLFDEYLQTNAIKYLPLKTNNDKITFGLTFQVILDSLGGWCCNYYNIFNKQSNSNIGTFFGNSIEDCAYKMYKELNKNK